MADQADVVCVRDFFQPLIEFRVRGLVQQRVGEVQFGRAADVQNNLRRFFRAHERAAVGGVEFDSRPLQEPSDLKRFLPAMRRERTSRIVNSIEGIGVAQEVKFHKPTARRN